MALAPTIPIVILAAGFSARMRGIDKLAENVDGEPLLRLVARRAIATGSGVFVALPAAPHPRDALLRGLSVTILRCPGAAAGMSVSLREAVVQLPPCPAFLLMPADLPEIGTADMAAIRDAPVPGEEVVIWRAATADDRPGHPVLFDAALRPEFADLSGDDGGKPIIARHGARTRLIPLPGNRARRDLDTPEDWAAFRAETGR